MSECVEFDGCCQTHSPCFRHESVEQGGICEGWPCPQELCTAMQWTKSICALPAGHDGYHSAPYLYPNENCVSVEWADEDHPDNKPHE